MAFIVITEPLGDPVVVDADTGDIESRWPVTRETPNAWRNARARAARLNNLEVKREVKHAQGG